MRSPNQQLYNERLWFSVGEPRGKRRSLLLEVWQNETSARGKCNGSVPMRCVRGIIHETKQAKYQVKHTDVAYLLEKPAT